MHTNFHWYRFFIKLYPKEYRQEYEKEMLDTYDLMNRSAQNVLDKYRLLVRVVKDYCVSLVQQNIYATEASFYEIPSSVKRQFSIGFGLVVPFLVIFIYNFIHLVMHHTVPLLGFENRTWTIYSRVLPVAGLAVVTYTCLSSVFSQIMTGRWREAFQIILHNWLFLGIIIALIAFVAIF